LGQSLLKKLCRRRHPWCGGRLMQVLDMRHEMLCDEFHSLPRTRIRPGRGRVRMNWWREADIAEEP
jgi:hypothetical protein